MFPRVLILLLAAALAACLPTNSDSSKGDRVTREFAFEYEIDKVTNEEGDSLGIGLRHGGNAIALYAYGESFHETGPYLLGYNRDSLLVFYYLPGSKAAWVALVPQLDSLDSLSSYSEDTASALQAFEQASSLRNAYNATYSRIKSYPKSACSFSVTGSAQVPSGNLVFDVPLVFSSITASDEGIVMLLDLNKSKPTGVSSIDLLGQTAKGSIQATCPDPN